MSSKPRHGVSLEGLLGGGCRLHVHGTYFDLHDYEVVQLGESVLRQLGAMAPQQLAAAEAAAASLGRSGR